ncbi:hypothetical protein JCM10207_006675 [Rhodosporidiobolus poonsookiae]
MFPSSKLFGTCPDWNSCSLPNCLFTHVQAVPPSAPRPSTAPAASAAPASANKRPAPSTPSHAPASKKVAWTAPGSSALDGAIGGATASTARASLAPSSSARPAPPTAGKTVSTSNAQDQLPAGAGPPRLPPQRTLTHTPATTRQKMLTALYNQFLELYTPGILPTSLRHDLASKHALAQEEHLFSRATKATYRNACIGALARLKKRVPARSIEDAGTLEDDDKRAAQRADEEKGRLTRARVESFCHEREKLRQFDYVLEVPEGAGADRPSEEGALRTCDRCKKEFTVQADLGPDDLHACSYHFGRVVTEKVAGVRQRVWSCCPAVGAASCQTGPHVFKDEDPAALHSRSSFSTSASLREGSTTSLPPAEDVCALDCELIYTISGMSLARLTVLSSSGSILLDEHVRPTTAILDLNTRFSGVVKEDLDKAILDLAGVKRALAQYIDERTILIGHGLENDLKALRIVHDKVIDTAILFPHPNGGTWRHSLRNLTKDILGKFIQANAPTLGHSAHDDASAALELVRWKVKKGGGG